MASIKRPRKETRIQYIPVTERSKAEPKLTLLTSPVPPLSVTIPKLPRRQPGATVTALLYGDTHIGYEDTRACRIIHAIGRDADPDILVHMGDLLDCYAISRFDKDPSRQGDLQTEINAARVHLAQARRAMPKAQMYLLEGNHEDRLRRVIWEMEGPALQLAKLDSFRTAMTWPHLLGLKDMGVTFVPLTEQTSTKILPKFIVKHGTAVRSKSAYSAHAEWSKYGRSGASGHTHRLGAFFHRDHNGNQVWVETGCTARLDPEYCLDPDWQQGGVVATFHLSTGAFQLEPIYIHNGLAIWRGKEYRAE